MKAGAQVLQIFESWAGTLPDGEFQRWCVEPVSRIVAGVRAGGVEAPIIGFPRGSGPAYARYAGETGVNGISCDTSLPLDFIARELQPSVTVQGNLDPLLLVNGGEALARRVDEILAALGEGPFIFNLGHGIVPQTPPGHVARLVAQIRQ